jgi:hypothetical protein
MTSTSYFAALAATLTHKWRKFKKWCRTYHKIIACVLLILLILISLMSFSITDSVVIAQYGGGSGPKISPMKMGTAMKSLSGKGRMLTNPLARNISALSRGMGNTADSTMDKMRTKSSVLYEILYQIAIVIIIFLIAFPAISLFIIAIVCYILLRKKLAYIKGL